MSRNRLRIFCIGLLIVYAFSLQPGRHKDRVRAAPNKSERVQLEADGLNKYTLEDFTQAFGRTYKKNSHEWTLREELFKKNREKLLRLRSKKDRSWTPGITKFMDYNESEYFQLLGYKGRRSRQISTAAIRRHASTEAVPHDDHNVTFPAHFTTATKGKRLTSFVRDQGVCGSCWAEAAMAVLEGVAETDPSLIAAMRKRAKHLKSEIETLSSQAMVSCTPNPKNCGGTGGCDGATAELGYEMVMEKGVPMAAEWAYNSGFDGKVDPCEDKHFSTSFRVTISGYKVLPSNEFNPLIHAMVRNGHPIAIAVDATNWNFYDHGIYSDTDDGNGDFTVNHEVTLVGFHMPPKHPKDKSDLGYYFIKNSWGLSWGEDGHMRLEMKKNESGHCGWDRDTHIGLACDGDPDEAWVCGTCGILYDATYPTGIKAMTD